MAKELFHFIGGERVKGTSGRFGDVYWPMTGEVAARVPLAAPAEVRAAIENAMAAQPAWAATNPQRRARVFLKFLQLVERDNDKLAEVLAKEHGKTIPDAKGDIQRGVEVAEFAVGIPHLLKGEYTEGAGPGIDIYSVRQPLGVVAGITPFNFPAMIPMWKFAPCRSPAATPSSSSPPSAIRLGADVARRTDARGGPAGRHSQRRQRRQGGGRRAVATIRMIQAVGFVGSTPIAEYVYSTRDRHRETRAVPSAAPRTTCSSCPTPTSTRLPTRSSAPATARPASAAWRSRWRSPLASRPPTRWSTEAHSARSNPSRWAPRPTTRGRLTGPLVTAAHAGQGIGLRRGAASKEGADLAVDGRDFTMQGYEPTATSWAAACSTTSAPDMRIYKEEIFGPGALGGARRRLRGGDRRCQCSTNIGNGVAIFTARRRHGTRLLCAYRHRHGRCQRADPGAARLLTPSAAGSGPASATSTSTGRIRSSSTRAPRRSPRAGRAAFAKAPSSLSRR